MFLSIMIFIVIQTSSFIAQDALEGFGTKGVAISFMSSEPNQEVRDKIQSSFVLNIPELPDEIDMSSYITTLK